MNIALTGSSGIIGSKILSDLKHMGHDVLCISSSISSHNDNVYLYEELNNQSVHFKADYIFHLASINSNLTESEVSLELLLMKKVIKSMKYINCKKIIFFSTCKVYGDNSFSFRQFDENSELVPKCFYGKAKVQCEETLIKQSSEHNFNYLIFRLPPVLLDNQKSALGKLLQAVQKGMPIPSFRIGDKNERSFLSYELLAHIIKLVISDIRNVNNNTLNLSDSRIISTHDLLRRFGKSVNKKPKIIYLPEFFFKAMMRVNRLQSILSRLYGNFHLSNAKLKKEFEVPDKF